MPEGFTKETGSRTFALNELMVIPECQGQGVAHELHDELLAGRTEERATLLVREDNTSAQNAYNRWGWKKIGKLRPFPDSPHFDAMILPLPGRGDSRAARHLSLRTPNAIAPSVLDRRGDAAMTQIAH